MYQNVIYSYNLKLDMLKAIPKDWLLIKWKKNSFLNEPKRKVK